MMTDITLTLALIRISRYPRILHYKTHGPPTSFCVKTFSFDWFCTTYIVDCASPSRKRILYYEDYRHDNPPPHPLIENNNFLYHLIVHCLCSIVHYRLWLWANNLTFGVLGTKEIFNQMKRFFPLIMHNSAPHSKEFWFGRGNEDKTDSYSLETILCV